MSINKKISELDALTTMTGSEAIPLAYGGANYRVTPYPFMNKRNLIDNPSFLGWRRGTSFASGASVTKGADRWGVYRGSAATGATLSRQTGSAGDPSFYYARLQRDNGDASVTAVYLGQSMESIDSYPYAGKTLSVSFQARKGALYSATSDVLSFTVSSGTGTDESVLTGFTGNADVTNTVTLTTSWQRFRINGISVPSNITQLGFRFHFTPTGTGGATDYVDIANVQVEESPVATIFVPEPFSVQQDRFLRFYETSYPIGTTPAAGAAPITVHWAMAADTSRLVTWQRFSVPKRASPTVTLYRTNHASGSVGANVFGDNNTATWTQASTATAANVTAAGFNATIEVTTGISTIVSAYQLGFNWTAEADLV